jgi:spermidine/putrescine-binding protein
MTEFAIGRRTVLRAGLGAISGLMPGTTVAKDEGPLAVTAFPGITEEMARTVIAPAFRQATSKAVNVSASLAVDAIAKVSASRANPPLDVIILDDPTGLLAVSRGLVQAIPADKVPNSQDVPAKLHVNQACSAGPNFLGRSVESQVQRARGHHRSGFLARRRMDGQRCKKPGRFGR